MPLTRLALYVLSLPYGERAARRGELTSALRSAARRAAGAHAGTWGRVAAVLDDSFSSSGSGEKRRRPLAVALGCHFLLEALAAPRGVRPAVDLGRRRRTARAAPGVRRRSARACWTRWRRARTGW